MTAHGRSVVTSWAVIDRPYSDYILDYSKMLLFPIKAITFIYRFLVLLAWTAYLEGSRDVNG